MTSGNTSITSLRKAPTFQNGFGGQNHTHINHTFNQGQHELCGSYHLLQSCFLCSSVSMSNLSRLVPASFSNLALLSSSVSTANLSCLLVTTFSSLGLTPTHCRYTRFNIFKVARCCLLWFSVSDDLFFPSCVFFFFVVVFFWGGGGVFSLLLYHFHVFDLP